jgi:hypothetical protein
MRAVLGFDDRDPSVACQKARSSQSLIKHFPDELANGTAKLKSKILGKRVTVDCLALSRIEDKPRDFLMRHPPASAQSHYVFLLVSRDKLRRSRARDG